MKKYVNFFIIVLAIIIIIPLNAHALSSNITPSQNSNYSSKDYVIDSYDINIKVNENNTFDINETITAYFNNPKHGIIRTIPLKNTVARLDGTFSRNRVKISNLSVNDSYTTSKINNEYKIQIGSADTTITGEKIYNIKYNYNIGKDHLKGKDELYFNIIGTNWDTYIGNITFNITMPKDFDPDKLGFSAGTKGSIQNQYISYTVKDNQITGSYNNILSPGEALTVRCELPEGYFISTTSIIEYLIFIIPILFLGISLLIWCKFGKDDTVIETVEFYPPEGLNSLEVGFLYKGEAINKDVTSLLIYLANKGYIKITETEEKSMFNKSDNFKITKLKDYDGNNINEKIFLEGLFAHPSSLTNGIVEVKPINLYDEFYQTQDEILYNINSKENKNKLFEKHLSLKNFFIILMILITFVLITIPPMLIYGELELLILALLFPGIGFSIVMGLLFSKNQTVYINGKPTNSRIAIIFLALLFGICFCGVPLAFSVLPALLQDSTYLIGYISGLICIIGMILCVKFMPKRTTYGNEILGKLKGFKNFLETAEKPKLEAMVLENPNYFYDILPFTYVLGVSDKWIKKFESISLKAPNWYDSTTGFSISTFGTFMNTTMTSASRVMSSSPYSSSGGSSSSSSGGGFSGGGSGGGGGSSW